MRTPLLAANWKMNKTIREALQFVAKFMPYVEKEVDKADPWPELVICPPFTSIPAVSAALAPSPVSVGAQDVYWKESGAFTGEISPAMLKDAGCRYVIIGHSERRQYFGESDDIIQKKVRAALDAGLRPILCVGETLAERERGEALPVCTRMACEGLALVKPEELRSVVIAYEPVWAIGTGKEARPQDAQEVICAIREALDSRFGPGAAAEVRVLYGGSVRAANIRSFVACPDIDGALVGGASLDPDEFGRILSETVRARPKNASAH